MKNKKGASLVEVILAIAIFAVIALPLLTVFVQSIKVDKRADDLLNANYISQKYLEELDAKTYLSALGQLDDLSTYAEDKGYFFTAKITPYGTLNYLFTDPYCSYVHIIVLEDQSVLCVMPDGKWHRFLTLPSSFSLTISYKTYTFTGGFTMLTGSTDYNYCAMMVNAMKKTNGTKTAITLNGNCKAALYCTEVNSGDITFSGENRVYEDMIKGDKSLISVKTSLYDPSKENVIATSDCYINIKNW